MTNRERVANLLIGLVATAAIAGVFLLDPIPQDPAYHGFADRVALFGIPNFWNVATNLPFLALGLAGLLRLSRLRVPALRPHYLVFCIGITLVGLGSAWYHWDPTTPTLVWDRLPMTVAFMALFAALIADRISPVLGRALLGPLVVLGISSIAWWIHTELLGRGDLRPYAVVQFLPLLLIPLLLLRPGALHAGWLWATLGAYVVAKLAEHFDGAILDALDMFSGHSLKHLFAALGAWCALRAFLSGAGAHFRSRSIPDT